MNTINSLFPDQITKITNSLLPPNFIGDSSSIRRTQDSVIRVVDDLGGQSAEEQGLGRVITTADKLRTADGHILYVLKDSEANSGAGEAVGLLKVGRKHLYLFDGQQTVREVEPLCVLDFFIKKSHQRRGKGKMLFDHMLQDQNVSAVQLAVDGPSSNMRAFLAKNYDVKELIKQANNFAVSPQFFGEVPATARHADSQRLTDGTLNASQELEHRDLQNLVGSAPRRSQQTTPPQPAGSRRVIRHVRWETYYNGNNLPNRVRPLSMATTLWRYKTRTDERNRGEDARQPTVTGTEGGGCLPHTSQQATHLQPATRGRNNNLSRLREKCQRASSYAPTPASSPLGASRQAAGLATGAGDPKRPSSLAVAPAPPAEQCPAPATPAGTPSRRDSQLTDKGFFDVKFYHKKLW